MALCWSALCCAQEADTAPQPRNAVLEAVQISSAKGALPDEKTVSCYFIFSDRPSDFTYNVDAQARQIVFTFGDAEMGSSAISSLGEPPIMGFEIQKQRVNRPATQANRGGGARDEVQVTFRLAEVPNIAVTDELGVISFSYQWTSDPAKTAKYTLAAKRSLVGPISFAALGGIGLGAIVYLFSAKRPEKDNGAIPIDDRPRHELPR